MKTYFNHAAIILRNIRRKSGLTQAAFSERLDVHVQFVSNWERSLCAPPKHCLKKLFKGQPQKIREDYVLAVSRDAKEQMEEEFKELGVLIT